MFHSCILVYICQNMCHPSCSFIWGHVFTSCCEISNVIEIWKYINCKIFCLWILRKVTCRNIHYEDSNINYQLNYLQSVQSRNRMYLTLASLIVLSLILLLLFVGRRSITSPSDLIATASRIAETYGWNLSRPSKPSSRLRQTVFKKDRSIESGSREAKGK